jgi:hypothetical protein
MKIIITENQLFLFRRIQDFIDIVEDQIDGYETQENNPWWCKNSNPEDFLKNLKSRSIEIFVDNNWDFFHDKTKTGGSNMDISILNDIVNREYGNYIRNLFVSKCNYSRF